MRTRDDEGNNAGNRCGRRASRRKLQVCTDCEAARDLSRVKKEVSRYAKELRGALQWGTAALRVLRSQIYHWKRGYKMSRRNGLFLACMGLLCLFAAVLLIPYSGASAAEKKEILIGAVNSLTGENVLTAAECKWAYEQAIADVNKKGGIFVKEFNKKLPVRLVFADDKSTADGGAAAMERLIKVNHIDLALSSNITPINLAAATVAEKYKMYYSIATSWLDFVEKENYKYVSDFFTDTGRAAIAPFEIWKKLPAEQRPKNPALLVEDSPDGQGFGGGVRATAKAAGVTFAIDEPFNVGANDFSAQILKYKAAKVDALLTLMSPEQAVLLVRQFKEQGYQNTVPPRMEGVLAQGVREDPRQGCRLYHS